jgi:hypothetical protein
MLEMFFFGVIINAIAVVDFFFVEHNLELAKLVGKLKILWLKFYEELKGKILDIMT